MARESTCKNCGGAIIWARREATDRWIPLDVASSGTGEYVLTGWDDPPVATRAVGELAGAPGHSRHDCKGRR